MNHIRKHVDTRRVSGECSLTRRDVLATAAAAIGASSGLIGLPQTAWGQTERVVKKGRIKQSICGGCLRKAGLDQEQTAKLLVEMGLVVGTWSAGMTGTCSRSTIWSRPWCRAPGRSSRGSTTSPGTPSSWRISGRTSRRRRIQMAQRHLYGRRSQGHRRGGGDGQLPGDPQGGGQDRRGQRRDPLHGNAQQQGEPPRLHVRQLCVGLRAVPPCGFPRFKLLFDIYHMQIMEGDLIATIRKNIQHIGHFHTAGVPGRHELDENQEIYYPAVMRAIAETGYDGYVAHEYTPTRDPIQSLIQAVATCDV